MRSSTFLVSIVVPCYNEQECLPELLQRIIVSLSNLSGTFEVLVIDDGGTDDSFKIVSSFSATDPRIKGIKLSRNVGHQYALACGLDYAKGDVVITMDADLQHPPELLPEMIKLWQEGYDVVKTRRNNPGHISYFEKVYSHLFYKLFNRIVNIAIEPNSADFRLLDRKALEAIKRMPEKTRFYRGMVHYIGFSQTTLPFICPPRFAGSRRYTFKQSLRLAGNGIFSFSDTGLKVPLYLGLAVLLSVFIYLAISVALHFYGNSHFVSGWFSIIFVLFLSLGLQLVMTGIFGLYLSKIYREIQNRPLYFVDKTTPNAF